MADADCRMQCDACSRVWFVARGREGGNCPDAFHRFVGHDPGGCGGRLHLLAWVDLPPVVDVLAANARMRGRVTALELGLSTLLDALDECWVETDGDGDRYYDARNAAIDLLEQPGGFA